MAQAAMVVFLGALPTVALNDVTVNIPVVEMPDAKWLLQELLAGVAMHLSVERFSTCQPRQPRQEDDEYDIEHDQQDDEQETRMYKCAECDDAAEVGAHDEEDGLWYCKCCW